MNIQPQRAIAVLNWHTAIISRYNQQLIIANWNILKLVFVVWLKAVHHFHNKIFTFIMNLHFTKILPKFYHQRKLQANHDSM